MRIRFVGGLFFLLILVGFPLTFGVLASTYLAQETNPSVSRKDYCETERYYQNMAKWLQQDKIQNKLHETKPIINLSFVKQLKQQNFLPNSLMKYVEGLLNYISHLFLQNFLTGQWKLSSEFQIIPEQTLCHFPDLETDLTFLQELKQWKQKFTLGTKDAKLENFINYHYLRIWLQKVGVQLSFNFVVQKKVFADTFPLLDSLTEIVSDPENHPDYFFLVLKPKTKIDKMNVTTQQIDKFVSWNSEKIKNIYQESAEYRLLKNGFPLVLIAFALLFLFTISNLWSHFLNGEKEKTSTLKIPPKNSKISTE